MYNSRTIHNILAKAAFVCSIPRFCNGLYTLQPATRRSHPTEKTIRETLDHGYRTHGPDGHTVGHRRCRGHQFAEAAECSDEGENQVQHDSDPVRRWGPTDRGLDCPLGGKGKLHTLVPSSWHCDTSHTWGGGEAMASYHYHVHALSPRVLQIGGMSPTDNQLAVPIWVVCYKPQTGNTK